MHAHATAAQSKPVASSLASVSKPVASADVHGRVRACGEGVAGTSQVSVCEREREGERTRVRSGGE